MGELPEAEAEACRSHIEACEQCGQAYREYARLVEVFASEPETTPSAAESESLALALAWVELAQSKSAAREPLPRGLPALICGSLAAFVAVAVLLTAQMFGCIDITAPLSRIGPVPVALAVVIAILITSFLPIAQRKPWNGMTFKR
jgi:anti-sigma factor RsiW